MGIVYATIIVSIYAILIVNSIAAGFQEQARLKKMEKEGRYILISDPPADTRGDDCRVLHEMLR